MSETSRLQDRAVGQSNAPEKTEKGRARYQPPAFERVPFVGIVLSGGYRSRDVGVTRQP